MITTKGLLLNDCAMENQIKLSIIIPIYNCEKYLRRCFDSILKQALQDFEVIAVNDGSTDNSLMICDEYHKLDSRFKVYNISNHGAAYARNIGLKHARGVYIGFIDSDDYIAEDMYSSLLTEAFINDADIVSCDIVYVYKDGKEVQSTYQFNAGVYGREAIVTKLFPILICSPTLEIETPFTMVLKVFKRSFLQLNRIKFEDSLRAGQDYVFATTAFFYAKTFVYLKHKYSYFYYQNEASRTHRFLPKAWQNYLDTNKYWLNLTANCSEFDFTDQIRLDKFHGLLMSVNYIFKPGNPSSNKEKITEVISLLEKEIEPEVFDLLSYKNMSNKKLVSCFLLRHGLYRVFTYLLSMYYIFAN